MTDFPFEIKDSNWDFSEVHRALRDLVDSRTLPMALSVVLRGQEVVDFFQAGWQDREEHVPVSPKSIVRLFSNTKPVTAVAAMILWERGAFGLESPLTEFFPEFSDLKVLRDGASEPTEVEDLRVTPTVRHLLCHTAGFSYGIFGESLVDPLYGENRILSPAVSLEQTVENLARIPLAYQPGRRFQYSVSMDVAARLVEIVSGKTFGEFVSESVLQPLGMVDTGFHVQDKDTDRFCVLYGPKDPMSPMEGECYRTNETSGAFTREPLFESGGGGLVSTIVDYTRFMQMVAGEGSLAGVRLLRPETVRLMRTPQLPDGVRIQLPTWEMPGTSFGIGFALKQQPAPGEPKAAVDEFHWGGLAGTHTWVAPRAGVAALCFTQRMLSFWHPFGQEFKRGVYEAVCR